MKDLSNSDTALGTFRSLMSRIAAEIGDLGKVEPGSTIRTLRVPRNDIPRSPKKLTNGFIQVDNFSGQRIFIDRHTRALPTGAAPNTVWLWKGAMRASLKNFFGR